jgi:hypothetical protein
MALIAMALCEHGMEGRRSLRGFDGVGFVPSLDGSFRAGVVDELPPMIPPGGDRLGSARPFQGLAWTIGQAVKCLSTMLSTVVYTCFTSDIHTSHELVWNVSHYTKNSITPSNPMLKKLMYWLKTNH